MEPRGPSDLGEAPLTLASILRHSQLYFRHPKHSDPHSRVRSFASVTLISSDRFWAAYSTSHALRGLTGPRAATRDRSKPLAPARPSRCLRKPSCYIHSL